jgi:hypothetical protein
MQFSILMKNEGNGHLAVRQTRKMPGDYLLKVIKTEGIKVQHLLDKMYNKKAQIELTLLVMFVFL